MPNTCAPMIGKTECCRHHHAEARERGQHRRPHARPHHDLAQRRDGRLRGCRIVAGEELGDRLRVRADERDEPERDQADPAGRQPRHRQSVCRQVAPREQRPEHRRAEDRAEDGAEEDVGDPARAPLRRVHVARRGADQQRDAARRAGQAEAEDHERRRVDRGRERRQPAARRRREEAGADDRLAPDPIHRAAGRHGRQRRRREEDRRAQAEQPLDARHEHERERRDGGDELQHRGVDRHGRRENHRIAADRQGCRDRRRQDRD